MVGVALKVTGRDGAGGFGEGDGLPAGVDTRGDEVEGVCGVAAGEESGEKACYSKRGYFYEAADETTGFAGGHKVLQAKKLDTEVKCLQQDPERTAIRRRLTSEILRDNDPNGAGLIREIGRRGALGGTGNKAGDAERCRERREGLVALAEGSPVASAAAGEGKGAYDRLQCSSGEHRAKEYRDGRVGRVRGR